MQRDVDAPPEGNVSRSVAKAFGPILIVVGILGFIVPAKRSATSGAPAYNVFHLVFGTLGIACARRRRLGWAHTFNIGFGALDLYQALASRRGWFPQRWFRWKTADDLLHIGIGTGLVVAGIYGAKETSS